MRSIILREREVDKHTFKGLNSKCNKLRSKNMLTVDMCAIIIKVHDSWKCESN